MSFEELAQAAVRQPVGVAASPQALSATEAIVADLVDESVSAANSSHSVEPAAIREADGDAHHHPAMTPPPPSGSRAAVSTPATPYYAPPAMPIYPSNAGATGGAIASVVLGVMALATIKFITPGALLISILGVGMGVWGLYSDRRTAAVLGLLLCCLAMSISGFLSAVQLFELINGYNPFEGDLPPVDSTAL